MEGGGGCKGIRSFLFSCSLFGVNGRCAWFLLFVVGEVNFCCCLDSSNMVFRDFRMAIFLNSPAALRTLIDFHQCRGMWRRLNLLRCNRLSLFWSTWRLYPARVVIAVSLGWVIYFLPRGWSSAQVFQLGC